MSHSHSPNLEQKIHQWIDKKSAEHFDQKRPQSILGQTVQTADSKLEENMNINTRRLHSEERKCIHLSKKGIVHPCKVTNYHHGHQMQVKSVSHIQIKGNWFRYVGETPISQIPTQDES